MTGEPHLHPAIDDLEGEVGDARVWTNVYVAFSLTRRDRAILDAHLRSKDSSLSMRLRAALVETLGEAGVGLPTSDSTGQGHQH
jgi:hypothetical protein